MQEPQVWRAICAMTGIFSLVMAPLLLVAAAEAVLPSSAAARTVFVYRLK